MPGIKLSFCSVLDKGAMGLAPRAGPHEVWSCSWRKGTESGGLGHHALLAPSGHCRFSERPLFWHLGPSVQTGAQELMEAEPGQGLRGLRLPGSGTSSRTWPWSPGFWPIPPLACVLSEEG